jgi:hypothetical protein
MAAEQRRSRLRRAACVVATIAASAALAAGPVFAAGLGVVVTPPSAPPPPPPPPATRPMPLPPAAPEAEAEAEPAFGAYLHYGEQGVARMAELSRWLGGADLRVGHTYLPGDRWSNIEGAPAFLQAWADWRAAREDRIFVLNVPMLEGNEEKFDDAEVRALLRQGAAGRFDHHFRALAQRLVGLGLTDTVLVLGWEMNGETYTHRCGPDPVAWKRYWNRIVTAMRAVPGQEFRFDFAPNRGRDAIAWTECYPGDDTVDVIGMDSYDQPEGVTFDEQVNEPYGLQDHVDFAKAHGKPVSYPEWGLFRNDDNPVYMQRMLDWMDRHRPLYNTLSDYCPHGVWQCDANPQSAAVYRSFLYGRGAEKKPADQVTPPPAPTAPTEPPQDCSPLMPDDWMEHWLGGELCVKLDWWTRIR